VTDNLPVNTDAANVASMMSAMEPHSDPVAILGVLIPIVAIVMGLSVGMLVLWLDFRKKREMFQLHHAERMAAIEKGIEIPPLPPEFFSDFKRRDRNPNTQFRRGVVWLLVGLALMVAMHGQDDRHFWWGLIPVAVGLANLLSYAVERRRPPETQKLEDRTHV
jgi:hypothetical protein